jgi:hypothetical protein
MKIKYHEKALSRLKQKIKLLVARPDFQKDIQELRTKWKIPSNGIKDEQENENWNMQLGIDTDEYYDKNWPKERKELLALRKAGKHREADEIKKKINADAPLNAFNNDIWSVIRKYRLSPKWNNGIRRYLLFNDPTNLNISFGIPVKFEWENGMRRIYLEIDEDTTLDDLKNVWSWARKLQRGKKYDKYQPIKNFDRDNRAYELQLEGRTEKEIGDIIQEEFGDTLDYNELNIAIKRHKKRLNIN